MAGSTVTSQGMWVRAVSARGQKGQADAWDIRLGRVARGACCDLVLSHQLETGKIMVEIALEISVYSTCPSTGGVAT